MSDQGARTPWEPKKQPSGSFLKEVMPGERVFVAQSTGCKQMLGAV